jgi:hypothetical protein
MSGGGYIYVFPQWNIVIMTRRFEYQGRTYVEKDGQVFDGTNFKQGIKVNDTYHHEFMYVTCSLYRTNLTLVDHLCLLPLTKILPEDLVRHIAKFLVSGHVGVYLLQ